MKRILSILLVLLLALGASALAEAAPADAAISVVDGNGHTVVLDAYPERIISLTPSNTEILFALGLGDKVVGVDASSDYPPEVAGLEIMGDYAGPNLESIVAAEPDVVFAGRYLADDAMQELDRFGIPVVCNDEDTYDGIAAGIQLVADVTGADASAVLADMEAAQSAALAQVVAREEPLKVYYAVSFGEYGDYTAGPGTFIDEMIAMAGGVNVAGGAEMAWPSYSLEQLIVDDPDVIIISDYIGDRTTLAEQLSASEGYKELRCVQAGNVFCLDGNTSSRPAPRINEALADLVEILNSVK